MATSIAGAHGRRAELYLQDLAAAVLGAGLYLSARSGKSTYYRLETFLLEGSQGNDLMDYSKEQVITDILDQYERHLNFIHLHREAPGNSVMFPDG